MGLKYNVLTHGRSGYAGGCRCITCKESATLAHKEWAHKNLPKLASYVKERKQKDPIKAREIQARWYSNHREEALARMRESRLKRLYNLSIEDVDKMLVDQNSRCSICGVKFSINKNTHIDHCHKTLQLRDLLCNKCNAHLGWFEEYTSKISDYLNKHKGKLEQGVIKFANPCANDQSGRKATS